MSRAQRISGFVKSIDRDLYCEDSGRGFLHILRKNHNTQSVWIDDDVCLTYPVPAPQFIIALTRDWTQKTEAVDWGLEPIRVKLREIDTWNNDESPALLLEQQEEKINESRDRHLKNETEAFVKDFRTSFARATNDVNTSTLNKIDRRK